MDETITRIIALEWRMFQSVRNEGGRAICQDDWQTFLLMRSSQFRAWTAAMRESYCRDLLAARAEGMNPVAIKYARMMESTANERYRQLEPLLPPVSPEKRRLADAIVPIQLEWQREFAAAYPALAARSRPIGGGEDGPSATSVETYLRGELLTCSEETLRLYLDHVQALRAENRNMNREIMQYTVEAYGYATLEEAEAAAAKP